ncbi:MAG: hypothetical protein RIS78_958 [Bacteroidota bacterium]|jgi:hypothetical protein|nr:hypothetical protein [Sphingobacteriia bacterium]
MPLPLPLDQERLRCIRSSANLVGFGQVVYTVEGARWQASESRLRPPRYHWLFVPQEVPSTVSSEDLQLTEPLRSALELVVRQGGSVHVEGWGLLRKVDQGVELMADPGPLSDDHPHYGWLPMPWTHRLVSSVRSSTPAHSRSTRTVWVYAFAWLALVGLSRIALVVDGTEPSNGQRLAWAGYLNDGSLNVPFTRSTDPFDPCLRQATLMSPIEKPGVALYPTSWPVHRVVVGLYSQKPLAEAKLTELRGLGYSVRLTPRWAHGRWLTAVCLEYRGLYIQDFLQEVRSNVVSEAWIWPEAV